MPSNRVIRVAQADDGVAAQTLRAGIAQIQRDLGVSPDFPPEVEAAAAAAAQRPRLPDLDRTDLPFVTIDPPTSMDLDQAMHLARNGDGYTVHYAIADLAAFITPGDAIDVEAHRRGESLYGADSLIPLHPAVLSEGAASLLPGEIRPALLWTIELDETGEAISTHVERARVRSTAKLDYAGVQQQLDAGTAPEMLQLLREIGRLRQQVEAKRGGVNLTLPDQEIEVTGDEWRLAYRSQLPVEEWNAQISLLTGFGAADLMVYARVGILRTLPPPDPRDVQHLHRTARALGIDWPAEMLYPDFIRTLDPTDPRHAAMTVACTRLLRGSGYAAFDGELPALTEHAALASEYAHVTAPLRRLVDRYAAEVCVALCADQPVPDWVHQALATLPEEMRASGHRSSSYEHAVVDLVEAGVLAKRVGQTFQGVIVEVDEKTGTRGSVTIQDPAVEAPVVGAQPLPLGTDVTVTLASADVATRTVAFELG
ncbi:RNB domain-containing ribonuclease [Nocardioides sp.]|uniref:RNB domain-containing ribonuclease n=1 Tax=Nocardioides sp. TaxID=35761 RepID=UPI002CC36B90|nr:RNB domain-containing ribonuclease [Nocardioides sp.]HVX53033.1 RNB domain-containing ribonuclease [Nocardioides sp.]